MLSKDFVLLVSFTFSSLCLLQHAYADFHKNYMKLLTNLGARSPGSHWNLAGLPPFFLISCFALLTVHFIKEFQQLT